MAVTSFTPNLKRRARALPGSVLEQCTICLEEKTWSDALSLLTNSLTSGTLTNAPACVAPSPHLTLLATLVLHPKLTTGTDDRDRHAAADAAFQYLRLITDTVDITETSLKDAFLFDDSAAGRRASKRAKSRASEAGTSDEEDDRRSIRSPYAEGKTQALRSQGKDFWAVLGWAFNCSVRHKGRWVRWKAWLELVIDVLEADLEATYADEAEGEDRMRKTLMAQYLSTIGEGRNNKRRIMRAVLADGSHKSMAEFGEVWGQETKPPKKRDDDENPSKRQKLDLDNNEFGDYCDDQEEDYSQESKKRPTRGSSGKFIKQENSDEAEETETVDEIGQFGGMESIRLRQRVLVVLTRFSYVAPSLFTTCEELFEVITEFLRPLPLVIYQQFILPLKPYLDPNFQVALNEMMFQPLLGLQETTGHITQTDFETRFAPATAMNTSAIDNAKVALLTESILRALWKAGQLQGDLHNLRIQVKSGIDARADKAGPNWGKQKDDPKVRARDAMEYSGQRMEALIDMLTS